MGDEMNAPDAVPGTRRSWIPAAIAGALCGLLVVVAFAVTQSGDDDSSSSAGPEASSVTTDSSPGETEAPAETDGPPATDAPVETEPPKTDPSTSEAPTTLPPVCADYIEQPTLPLELCDSGLRVRDLQFALSTQRRTIDPDGLFDANTDRAVEKYQKSADLEVDGIVGEATWASMFPTDVILSSSGGHPAVRVKTLATIGELSAGGFVLVDQTPDGETATALTDTGELTLFDSDGLVVGEAALPPTIDGAELWSLAVGPERIIYASYAVNPGDGDFIVVALTMDSPAQEVGRWRPEWECVETFCGEIILEETGFILSFSGGPEPYVNADAQPSGAVYVTPSVPEVTYDVLSSSSSDQGFALDTVRVTIVHLGNAWTFTVEGASPIEGDYVFAAGQADGSALVQTYASEPDGNGRPYLLWFGPAGGAVVFDTTDVVFVDQGANGTQLMAVAIVGDEVYLVDVGRRR